MVGSVANRPCATIPDRRAARGAATIGGSCPPRASLWPAAPRRAPGSAWWRVGGGPGGAAGTHPGSADEREREATGIATSGPILVVDDDPAILDTVGEILALEGYDVVLVPDGLEALRRSEERPPALVLLDMRMPVISGWDVARLLRERGVAAPIVAMTAAQDARDWAEQIAADGYLAKPFDLDELLDAIERTLGR